MKAAHLSAAILLSCLTFAPAVAGGDQGQSGKKNDDQIQKQQARFRGMDTNRDGVITRREWRGNARSFERHDVNRDGVLSGNEVWVMEDDNWRERAERDSVLDLGFRRADANRDGVVSRSEWHSDAESFNRVDVNDDGVITEREYAGEGWATWDDEESAAVATRNAEVRRESRAYQSGYDRGLADGREAGREDKRLRNQWDLEGQRELEQADAGYTSGVGSRQDYQAGYRAGFRAGYRQGFGRN